MVADVWTTSSQHTSTPRPLRVKRDPVLRIQNKLSPKQFFHGGGYTVYSVSFFLGWQANRQKVWQSKLSWTFTPLETSRKVASTYARCSSSGDTLRSKLCIRCSCFRGSLLELTATVIWIGTGPLNFPIDSKVTADSMTGTVQGLQNGLTQLAFPPAV